MVGGVTAVGLALRLPSLGNSLFGDELSSYFIVTGHSLERVLYILNGHTVELSPPLYFVAAWLVERLGDSVHALRLVSLLAGTAAIPMTYLLGRWTVSCRAGVAGAAVMALSPYLIFYSTEARAYALLTLLLLASTLALLKALRDGGRSWWTTYAVCSCAAMYTHYIAAFVLLAQVIWAWSAHHEARKPLIASNFAAAIAFLPWLPVLVKDYHSPGTRVIGFLHPFGLQAVRTNIGHWAIGHPYLPLSSVPGPVALAMLVSGCAAGVIGIILSVRQNSGRDLLRRPRSAPVLAIVLTLAMPLGLILYSLLGTSVWDERNLIASWPGLAVVIGAIITSGHGLLRAVTVCFVTGAFAIGAYNLLSADNQRPDYRAAVAFIDRTGARRDPIAELPGPSPGPLSEVDAALAGYGPWMHQRRPVLRVGQASREAVLRAAPYAALPPPSARALDEQAARQARGSKLFVVSFGDAPASAVENAGRLNPRVAFGPVFGSGVTGFLLGLEFARLPPFISALPAGFRLIQIKTFPGFLGVSVYVFSDRPNG